jgi:N-acetylglucosaminyl-diphospho-decaprenol L-rhamnosyltransferase
MARADLDVIVVVSTGGRDYLRDCLESLRTHPLRTGEMKVWVVDSGSEDGSGEMVRQLFPEVELISLQANEGFCRGNNLALSASAAPLALLLNPDTEVTEGALDHMISLMRRRPDIGLAGCRLVKRDGTLDHAAKRSFPTPLGALAHFTGIGRLPWAPRVLAQYRAPELGEFEAGEVDSVNGAFMLARREAIEQVGLLDEGYWVYMEDLDWCYRFKRAGWPVYYDGGATVVHVKGGTTGLGVRGLRHNYAFHRSMARFYRKHYSGRRPWFDPVIYVAIAGKLALSIVRNAAISGARRLRGAGAL